MTSSLDSPVHRKLWATVPTKLPLYTELLVVGGGLSGCAAAVAAARLGVKVVVVEPTHMLGGQAGPAGVSAMDVTMYYENQINGYGLWSEFRERVTNLYRYRLHRSVNVSQYRDNSFAPNPVVVDRVLTQMLTECGVRVFRNVRVEGAEVRRGNAQVQTSAGTVTGKIVVDATEDGSVIRHSRLPHRLGNAVFDGTAYNRADLDRIAVQDITQTAMIRQYAPGTLPPELRLTEPPEGYENFLPFILNGFPHGPGTARIGHINGFAGYRAAPDLAGDSDYTGSQWELITRTSLNFHNDQPVCASYFTDESERIRFEREAIARTLSILYYLQHDLGLDWGVTTDEGFGEGPVPRDPRVTEGFPEAVVRHLPPVPYIRESVRLIGRETMTGKTIFRRTNRSVAPWDVTAVAVGTYPPDLHGGRTQLFLEEDLGESVFDKPRTWREGPFAIPLDSLLPQSPVPLIAAEKNLSASRVAAAAVRLHPTVTAVGQAAGTLAALALTRGVAPHDVPSVVVQAALLRQGAHLVPHAVQDLSRDDDRYAAVQLAVAHRLVDVTEVKQPDSAPLLKTDLDRAHRLGQAVLAEYSHWIDALETHHD
ncbi:hypothetical protein GCM10011374_29590 [Kocuria dechangensis]|uniref:FAD dependent oxidoreductase n=1 Tax=Kocuria dechangensis TaxID=1176249 RepID=A0A917LXT0_9MICC|nr:FAD-dependent oxidoreductase [Kocuria dechangensis]GGG64116.1 hypothetical protein GCM10011374_29590 [Kocuria dechangensis]